MVNLNSNTRLQLLPIPIFFFSGAAALIFENLWFRLAGLNVGNSIWGATVVLGGFMGGLALGNALVSRYGHYITRPVYCYIVLEFIIAVSGLALVLVLPSLVQWLSPLFTPLLNQTWLLNILRLLIVFVLLLIPTTAMGATLPLMVKAVCNLDSNFGSVLGRLYGWNTLGAVTGVIVCEFALIELAGITNSGFIAVLFNLTAIILALRLASYSDAPGVITTSDLQQKYKDLKFSVTVWRLLCAAFIAGMILLALEVVWFRFLLLTISGTSVIFAVMLVLVLAGIGAGGLVASMLYKKNLDITNYSRELAAIGGICTAITYICFDLVYFKFTQKTEPPLVIFLVYSSFLMFPVSMVSGMIFTTLGRAIKDILPFETMAVGLLTLANTVGAMFGALIAGLVLLTLAGMEKSFWLLTVCYGVLTLVIPDSDHHTIKKPVYPRYILGGLLLLLVIFFPFGLMKDVHFKKVFDKWGASEVLEIREGLVATNFYYLHKKFDQPYYYRLMTNGYSMSGTSWQSIRYMKLFAYLPLALHPDLKNVLLISYGVGTTAKALTDSSQLKSIDIVDISKEVLEMSSVIYPDPEDHPLNDKRVNVHIEDGRFYLQTTDKKFDLITGEPPPPKINQVVNLYTQEYFQLIYNHLSEGGIATYWLPVYQLHVNESKSIIKAFCNIFHDCSLWTGAGLEWILIGTRNAEGPGTVENFSRQWSHPDTRATLEKLGIEKPAQLGAMFLADFETLNNITDNSVPLTDNFPKRLTAKTKSTQDNVPFFHMMMQIDNTRNRFEKSEFIKKIWPSSLRIETISYFEYQRMISDVLFNNRLPENYIFDDLHNVLVNSSLETLPLWILGSNYKEQEIIDELIEQGNPPMEYTFILANREISRRNYHKATEYLEEYLEVIPVAERANVFPIHLYLLCMTGKIDEANELANAVASLYPVNRQNLKFFKWMHTTFNLNIPDIYRNNIN